jgi:hypothetical protein
MVIRPLQLDPSQILAVNANSNPIAQSNKPATFHNSFWGRMG